MSPRRPLLPTLAALGLLLATASGLEAQPRKPAGGASRPKVILVGWDGADWTLLDRLMKEGRLPNLSALVGAGRTWDLESYQPMASPLVWNTIVTGRTPLDHGVADFQELDPKTKARLPISGRSRKVPAIWNVATTMGLKVGVVGFWATWPAEKVNGFLVSDRAAPVLFDPRLLVKSQALTWPEGLADGVRIVLKREWDPPYEEVGKALRVSRPEFDAAVNAGHDLEDPITGYRKILAATRVHARIGLDLYERERPDLTMVYFQGTDEIGHVAGRFVAPKLPQVRDDEYKKFKDAVEAIYVESDRILGQFRAKAGRDGATLVLVSDHGFKWGDDRPAFYSGVQFDTAFLWHRSTGVLAAEGPAIVPSKERGKADVFDLAPTLCRLMGLPPDPKFEGKPVSGLGGTALPPAAAPVSWEKTAKVERLVVREMNESERQAAEEFTKKLIALGYLTGSEAAAVDARPADRAGTETAGHYQNLATFLRSRGRYQESLPLYRKALEVNPKAFTAWMNYSIALFQSDRWVESDEALIKSIQYGYSDPEAAAYRRVSTYMQRIERRPEVREELVRYLRSLTAAFPANDRYRASLGKALFEEKKCTESQQVFSEIVAKKPYDVEALNLMALTSLCLEKPAEAREWFRKSLAVEPNQPAVREGLTQLERGGSPVR
jgi:predicted AlkP superfamily phosphohydrolase/phosphomutase/Flp pilus assembly protein TadD